MNDIKEGVRAYLERESGIHAVCAPARHTGEYPLLTVDAREDGAVLCAGGESGQPQQVSDAILEEAQRLAREGIDPDFFEQIRRASFGATLRALNSFENIAISMADGYFRGFDALRFPEAYASIEKADVERFLRENLTDSRRAISIIEPKKEG